MKVDAAEQARTSIADFYQTYRNLIFKKANEMANDPDYVEDLVQDTLYQLLRRKELFLSLSEAQQVDYCVKTIRNTAINHHKLFRQGLYSIEIFINLQQRLLSIMLITRNAIVGYWKIQIYRLVKQWLSLSKGLKLCIIHDLAGQDH